MIQPIAGPTLGLLVTHPTVLVSLSHCGEHFAVHSAARVSLQRLPSREPASRQLCPVTTHLCNVWCIATLVCYPG